MKKTTVCLLAFLLCGLASTRSFAQSSYHDFRYLLVYEPGTSQQFIDDLMAELNSTEVWESPLSGVRLCKVESFPFTIDNGGFPITISDINEVVDRAKSKSEVDSGGFDYLTVTDPEFRNNNSGEGMVPCIDDFATDVNGSTHIVKIGVFDTGVSPLINNNLEYAIGNYTGKDYVNGLSEPRDDHGHGTHIAGIIAGIINDNSAGSPPQLDIQFDIRKTHNEAGYGYLSHIILALEESIIEEEIEVANFSFSYYEEASNETTPMEYALQAAADEEVLIITSAGNSALDIDNSSLKAYPAAFDLNNILTVASNDCRRGISDFSNWGATSVDVSMIGEGVPGPSRVGNVITRSGTSQATAINSGIAALLASHTLIHDADKLKCAMINSADFAPGLEGWIATEGIVNAERALNELLGNNCEGLGINNQTAGQDRPTKLEESSFNSTRVSPNPFKDQIDIYQISEEDKEVFIRLRSLNGQLLHTYTRNLIKGENQLRLSVEQTLPSGLFILEIVSGADTENILLYKN